MKTEMKTYYMAVDCHGYTYGGAHLSQEAALPDARRGANLSAEASNAYALTITEVRAHSADEALGIQNAWARH